MIGLSQGRLHAYHILTSLMKQYLFRGQWLDPGVDVVSFYADQFPNGDMRVIDRQPSRKPRK